METINILTSEKRCEARAEYWLNDSGEWRIRCWVGKRKTPVHNYRMNSLESMQKLRDDFVNTYQRIANDSAVARQKEKDFVHTLTVGNILVSSWGYDQTNIDFYKVVALHGKKSISIVPIESLSNYNSMYMTGTKIPDPDSKQGEVKKGIYGLYGIKLESYSRAVLWNGKPQNYSSYA
jgi:hypothetical protein